MSVNSYSEENHAKTTKNSAIKLNFPRPHPETYSHFCNNVVVVRLVVASVKLVVVRLAVVSVKLVVVRLVVVSV